MINSYVKGRAFEQQIVRLLTEKTGKKWHRTPQSGAVATLHGNEIIPDGDVYSHEYVEITVECKACSRFSINEIYGKNTKFWKWIRQTKRESKGNDFLLFIKPNNQGIFVLSNSAPLLHKLGFTDHSEIRINSFYTMLKV